MLLFDRGMLALLNSIGFTPRTPYPLEATAPFGISQIVSSAFWGGLWGILFIVLESYFPKKLFIYWLSTLVFGLAPTVVNWFVVSPLKGLPIASGGNPQAMITGILVNTAWAIGTAIPVWLIYLYRKKAVNIQFKVQIVNKS